jgi:hypothetical protein
MEYGPNRSIQHRVRGYRGLDSVHRSRRPCAVTHIDRSVPAHTAHASSVGQWRPCRRSDCRASVSLSFGYSSLSSHVRARIWYDNARSFMHARTRELVLLLPPFVVAACACLVSVQFPLLGPCHPREQVGHSGPSWLPNVTHPGLARPVQHSYQNFPWR